MVLSILFTILQLLFFFFILYLTISFITGAPFVPSNKDAAFTMIEFANIKKGMNIYDLGSGDGKLLYMAADKGAYAYGYEINPFLVFFTIVKKLLSPNRKRIHVEWKNFWSSNLHDADVIFIYLIPWKMEKLEKKIIKETKKGTVVISNSFIFPNLKMTKKNDTTHVYAFTVI